MTPADAKALCIEAHKGQFRRPRPALAKEYSNDIPDEQCSWVDDVLYIAEPYSSHPIAVANMLETDDEKVVAYLHDVLEATSVTAEDLKAYKLPCYLTRAIQRLTKKPGQPYTDYLTQVCKDPISRKVKIADIVHNISDNPTSKQKAKYYEGIKYLLSAL